uniref:Uncharacterized protein n=1 Tax=Cacopsylla melanoneura TaxID=428564 RepID=A0A8D8Q712_9HEMI
MENRMGAVILSTSLPMSNLCLPKLLFSFPLTVFCDTIFLTSLSTYINCMYLRFYFTLNRTYLSLLSYPTYLSSILCLFLSNTLFCFMYLPIVYLCFVCSHFR